VAKMCSTSRQPQIKDSTNKSKELDIKSHEFIVKLVPTKYSNEQLITSVEMLDVLKYLGPKDYGKLKLVCHGFEMIIDKYKEHHLTKIILPFFIMKINYNDTPCETGPDAWRQHMYIGTKEKNPPSPKYRNFLHINDYMAPKFIASLRYTYILTLAVVVDNINLVKGDPGDVSNHFPNLLKHIMEVNGEKLQVKYPSRSKINVGAEIRKYVDFTNDKIENWKYGNDVVFDDSSDEEIQYDYNRRLVKLAFVGL
jgi:hypothetical protein